MLLQTTELGLVQGDEVIWLLLTAVAMLLGTFYFISRGVSEASTVEEREYYTVTILITTIASVAYLAMAFGLGLTEITLSTGRVVDLYWARYADWLFTTPLLLLDLALLADVDRPTIGALVGVDVLMIVTGFAGAVVSYPPARFIFWTISTIFMLVVLYFLWTSLTAKAEDKGEETASTFRLLRNITVVTWGLYPVVWLAGTEGLALMPLFFETLGFAVLDVTSKVVFGLILLRSRAIIGGDGEEQTTTTESDSNVTVAD